jgi:hypothetical protein
MVKYKPPLHTPRRKAPRETIATMLAARQDALALIQFAEAQAWPRLPSPADEFFFACPTQQNVELRIAFASSRPALIVAFRTKAFDLIVACNEHLNEIQRGKRVA